jgi:site-specific recombinase XerD
MNSTYDSDRNPLRYSFQLPNTFHMTVESHSAGVVPVGQASEGVAIGKAIELLIVAKRLANLRERYIISLRQLLLQFARGREDRLMSSFTVEDVESWLAARNDTLHTRIGNIGRLSSLFGFAVRRGWITKNPCDQLERIRVEPAVPRILSPDQAEKLMRWVQFQKPAALGYFAKTLFCGIRPEETEKLEASAIDENRRIIILDAAASKVRNRRIIHLNDTAAAWLAEARRLDCLGPVSAATRRRWIVEARQHLGWKTWPQDILRHSAASYLLARTQNAAQVAEWLGNSVDILRGHYKELVTNADTDRFWALAP